MPDAVHGPRPFTLHSTPTAGLIRSGAVPFEELELYAPELREFLHPYRTTTTA